jgi:hypothetical protein
VTGRCRYFAYGSNLHRAQMASLAPSAEPVGLARLPGWELFVNDHGVLSIRTSSPGSGAEVLGLVWSCTVGDLAVLDRFEAVDEGLYVRDRVTVAGFGSGSGAGGPAQAYWSVSKADGRPRPGYLEASVLPPMRSLGLPGPYVDRVEAWLAAGPAGPRWRPVPEPGTVFTSRTAGTGPPLPDQPPR